MNKKLVAITGFIALGIGTAVPGLCAESSVELGKKLFNDSTLGGSTNEKSCNS